MRQCYKCKETKDFSEFHKDRSQAAGYEYKCKLCKAQFDKEKRLKNPEKYREQARKSLEKNYEKIRASQKKHRELNREKICKRRREAREPKKREMNARESERRKLHRLLNTEIAQRERDKQKEYNRKNYEKQKPKRDAHRLVMYAVKLGMLNKPKECHCGSNIRIEAHHEDYSKPLEVQWLCKVCHVARHKELNE